MGRTRVGRVKVHTVLMHSSQQCMNSWQKPYQTGALDQITFGIVSGCKGLFNMELQDMVCSMEVVFLTSGRFIRRGRAANANDAEIEVASDVSDSELASWLGKPGASSSLQLLHGADKKKITKYLPPGNCHQLYHHYVATRQLIQSKAVSYRP